MLLSLHRICSWLSYKEFRFFNEVLRYEIMSWAGRRLRGTLMRAQHWIRHIFSPRPPTIHQNKPSYAKYSGRFIAQKKSRMHPHEVQLCACKPHYGQDHSPLAQKSAYMLYSVLPSANHYDNPSHVVLYLFIDNFKCARVSSCPQLGTGLLSCLFTIRSISIN